jgi:Ca2+-binding RTX toxin-like protein
MKIRLVAVVGALLVVAFPNAGLAAEKCFGEPVTIQGTKGRNTIVGTGGADVIHGGGSSDVIHGGGGDDRICGGNGFDTLYGGAGADRIDGGDNQDLIDGGPGDDVLRAEGREGFLVSGYSQRPGGEAVSYENAPGPVTVDMVSGTATGYGNDRLVGFSEIIGSDYSDTLIGGPTWNGFLINGRGGDDVIYGHDGNSDSGDFLAGGPGDDEIYGLNGFDLLRGNRGDDLLDGGPDGEFDMGDSAYYLDFYAGRWGSGFYPGAQGPISADLTTGVATGEGTDTLRNIEYVRQP